MTKSSISIRIYTKDWNYLKRIFPPIKNESLARYLERYVDSLKTGATSMKTEKFNPTKYMP